jgi:predicted lipoprotein with Yx(FWY)xxD motif
MRILLRGRLVPPAIVAMVAGAAAVSAATGKPTVTTLRTQALGTIVVDARGLTLYHLTSEKGGRIKCSAGCAAAWPPLLVPAGVKPKAGPRLRAAKLGTLRRPDGRLQVTYNGARLYRYAGDRTPGAVNGEGEGGVWFALAPGGSLVKPPATAGAAATSPGSTSPAPASTSSSSPPAANEGGYGGY